MRLAISILFLLGALPAQRPETSPPIRQWVTGKGVRTDGSAWSGASVTLFSNPWSVPAGVGFADEVHARANERGLFRAQVLVGRAYTVWASSPVVDRRYTVTGVVDDVVPGQPIELREQDEGRVQVEVRLAGLQAWGAVGPVRCDLFCMLGNQLAMDCGVPEDDRVLLPPVPRRSGFFRVRDRSGRSLASGVVPTEQARRAALLGDDPPADPNDDESLSRAWASSRSKA